MNKHNDMHHYDYRYDHAYNVACPELHDHNDDHNGSNGRHVGKPPALRAEILTQQEQASPAST